MQHEVAHLRARVKRLEEALACVSVVGADILERRAARLLTVREAFLHLERLAELAGEFARPPAEVAARGGAAPGLPSCPRRPPRAAAVSPAPFEPLEFIDLVDERFRAPSFAPLRTLVRATFALPPEPADEERLWKHAERKWLRERARMLVLYGGRRMGKTDLGGLQGAAKSGTERQRRRPTASDGL